jgi:phospholipid/cholesterol/gamma-HCH transport system permease protein
MGVFLGRALPCVALPPFKGKLLLQRIRFIGAQSVLVIVLTGAFTGMVLGFQGYYTLRKVGSEAFLGPLLALSLVLELGPVLSALMVAGRAGSAVTAEIGIMRLGEQIDALELMGLSPFRYLVVPNVVAAAISMPLLTAIFDVVGIGGGYLVGVRLLGVSPGVYLGEMESYVKMVDIMHGLYKSLSFGVIIGWVCCYKGFYARPSARGVSQATTEAVVLSSVLILVWDCFLTSVR